MNILVAPNDYYIFPTMVMLQSLFDNTILKEEDNWNVYLLQEDISKAKLSLFQTFVWNHGGECHIVEIPMGIFNNAPLSIHITKSAYYRLLAPFLLPREIDRILYLDSDLIAIRDVSDLYYSELSEKQALVVCEGIGVSQKDFSVYDNIGLPHDRLYFNSGVILMNLPQMLDVLKDKRAIFDFIATHNVLPYHDQDILNALFKNNLKYVDWHRWNQTIIHINSKEEASEHLRTATIIHYAGSDKPWKYDYKSWYFSLFWKYAIKLPDGTKRYWGTLLNRSRWRIMRRLRRLFN